MDIITNIQFVAQKTGNLIFAGSKPTFEIGIPFEPLMETRMVIIQEYACTVRE